jgi:ribosomal protein L12E/L44/L45/RPP1/RPP2
MLQSSVRPDLYAQRMLAFILKHTDYDEIMAQRAAAAKAAADAGASASAERKKLL